MADRTIPYDIVREIFSLIPPEDVTTISSCSMTSKLYQSLMQKILFNTVELEYAAQHDFDVKSSSCLSLTDGQENSRTSKLDDSLASNPKLSKYVRNVTIRIKAPEGARGIMERPQAPLISKLAHVLARLSNLSSFQVISTSNLDIPFQWYLPSIQEAIIELLSRNTALADVNLCGLFDVPASILRYLPNTYSLTLSSLISTDPVWHSVNRAHLPGTEISICRPKSFCVLASDSVFRGDEEFDGILNALTGRQNGSTTPELKHQSSLSFSELESLEVPRRGKNPNDIISLLGLVNPKILKHLQIASPIAASQYYEMSPNHQLPPLGNLISTELGLENMESLSTFTIHGSIQFRNPFTGRGPQGQAQFFNGASTDMMWISQVINSLPHPPTATHDATASNSIVDLSLRVVFEVDVMLATGLFNFEVFDFTPVVQSLKVKQHQWRSRTAPHLDLIVCDRECEFRCLGLTNSDFGRKRFWSVDTIYSALNCNPSLQFASDSEKVMLRVVDHCGGV
ncbi:hypothetical protein CVT24_008085 [Panaeolus cyanescens]|uniref:F-box domain-containing protein n=1 Tax=Panaeolus cyanescens TaxID=181874 RepID=A0A409W0K4_9AGAR|nr:hypothetical protein CVT24_008085 [Panaeolus cyanescens]